MKADNFKPQVDRFVFPVCHGMMVLLQAYKNDVHLLPKELDVKVATSRNFSCHVRFFVLNINVAKIGPHEVDQVCNRVNTVLCDHVHSM